MRRNLAALCWFKLVTKLKIRIDVKTGNSPQALLLQQKELPISYRFKMFLRLKIFYKSVWGQQQKHFSKK